MAFQDNLERSAKETSASILDYVARCAHFGYATSAADQATALAILDDCRAKLETLGATPRTVAVVANAVTITTAASTIAALATKQYVAVVTDAAGLVRAGRTVSWASATPAKATIDPKTGLLTAVATGTSVITATCEGMTSTGVTQTVS